MKRLLKLLLNDSYLIQVYNYKLAIYQHEQCEKTIQMHLFSLERRDFSLIVIFSVAFSLLTFMLASFWPDPFEMQSSKLAIGGGGGELINETFSNSSLEFSSQLHSVRLATNSIFCLNRELNLLSRVEFQLEIMDLNEIGPDELDEIKFKLNSNLQVSPLDLNSNFVLNDKRLSHRHSININCPIRENHLPLIDCSSSSLIEYKINRPNKRKYLVELSLNNLTVEEEENQQDKKHFSTKLNSLKLKSSSLNLTISYQNSLFKALTILTHMFFYCLSIWLSFWFLACLNEHKYSSWSIEQKFTAIQSVLLVLTNSKFN